MKRYALVVTLLVGGLGVCGTAFAATGPMADAGLDQTVPVETTVLLDAAGSTHPDGEVRAYEWTIRAPDGNEISPECVTCEQTQFTPEETGRYEVTVTVTDHDGATSTDTLYVYVEDSGPAVDLAGESTPDVGDHVGYTATAAGLEAELEEIAWAVDDEIVAVQPLDGRSDESELTVAFGAADTHRIQVVVTDVDGRTAFDQLFVQPQPSVDLPVDPPSTPVDVPAETPAEPGNVPEDTPEDEDTTSDKIGDPEFLFYDTDGYEVINNAGALIADSTHVGNIIESVGLDDGKNAPWEQTIVDLAVREPVDSVSTFLFGQDQETVNCEMVVGEISTCSQKVQELELDGQTTNGYSPDTSGKYSQYGLRNGERVMGNDPTGLNEGQEVEVTVVIQPEKDGVVDKAVHTAGDMKDSTSNNIQNFANSLRGDEESDAGVEEWDDLGVRPEQIVSSAKSQVGKSESTTSSDRSSSETSDEGTADSYSESSDSGYTAPTVSAYGSGGTGSDSTTDQNATDPVSGPGETGHGILK